MITLPLAAARKIHQRISGYHLTFVNSKGEDAAAAKAVRESVPPGLYEHWKSKEGDLKFYAVFGANLEQDTHAPFVSYGALYRPHGGILTCRHLLDEKRGFLTPIHRDVYQGPRFTLFNELELDMIDVATLLQKFEDLADIKKRDEFLRAVFKILR